MMSSLPETYDFVEALSWWTLEKMNGVPQRFRPGLGHAAQPSWGQRAAEWRPQPWYSLDLSGRTLPDAMAADALGEWDFMRHFWEEHKTIQKYGSNMSKTIYEFGYESRKYLWQWCQPALWASALLPEYPTRRTHSRCGHWGALWRCHLGLNTLDQ